MVPLFVVEFLGRDPSIAAYALTIFAVGNALVLIVSGRLSDRFGRKPFVVSGLLICGLGTIAMGFTDNLVVFFAIAAVTGVGSAHESGPAGRGCRCCRIDGPRRTRSGGIPDDVRHRWGSGADLCRADRPTCFVLGGLRSDGSRRCRVGDGVAVRPVANEACRIRCRRSD